MWTPTNLRKCSEASDKPLKKRKYIFGTQNGTSVDGGPTALCTTFVCRLRSFPTFWDLTSAVGDVTLLSTSSESLLLPLDGEVMKHPGVRSRTPKLWFSLRRWAGSFNLHELSSLEPTSTAKEEGVHVGTQAYPTATAIHPVGTQSQLLPCPPEIRASSVGNAPLGIKSAQVLSAARILRNPQVLSSPFSVVVHCCYPHYKNKCGQCCKSYASPWALKVHANTHTLPFACPICGKCFSRLWLLRGHLRTHTGEKPFQCPHCHRPFADRSNLRAHLQTHAVVKKYRCSSCLKSFSRSSLLAKHRVTCDIRSRLNYPN